MSSATVKPGDVLAGKYRVESVLGAGGMGYVVAARHLQLDQLVAMKFLRKGAVEGGEAAARFLREAKATVKLKNEHIAKVFDVGTLDSGEPYIVMEHLDGCDLAELAKVHHTLPPEEVVEYILQACEALAEAHSLSIVHRDIKLANLFVTRGPAGGPLVKVLDFGISKTNPFGESDHDMTRTASMLGSPRFMSPEQMRDPRQVDGRSDIWSLGVVIYRLVSGRPPFEADTLGRLLTMVMHEKEAPLASICKAQSLPPGFSEVVGRALAKDPNERYANVAELAFDLVPFSSDPTRAQSAAERIAAVLSLPHAPTTGELPLSHPSLSRAARAAGASDNTGGTNSPWSGTHNSRARASRSATIWLLAGLLAIVALFVVKLRIEEAKAPVRDDALPPLAVAPTQLPVTALADQPRPAEPLPTIIGASPIPPPPPTMTVAAPESTPTPARRVPPPPVPRTKAAPRSQPPAPAPSKPESGIPATRD